MKIKIKNPFLEEVREFLYELSQNKNCLDCKKILDRLVKKLDLPQGFSNYTGNEIKMLEYCAAFMLKECFDDITMVNICRNFLIDTRYFAKAGLDDISVFFYKKNYFIKNPMKI